jgi:RNA polymerase sigma-70 factor (ECF subfamily)
MDDGLVAAFEKFAAQVFPPLRQFAYRRADPHTAEDIVSETLLVAWRRFDEIPRDAQLPWCYAVARNCLANAQRSQRRQRNLFIRVVRVDPPTLEAPASEPPDPELHQALSRLSADDRELLQLWAWEQLDPAEIATVLGVSTNAVHIRLHRARKRLAAELGEDPRKL